MGLRVVLRCIECGHSLTIPGNPYPMYPYAERLNCVSIDSASGQRYVFDGGPTRVNASIVWKAISYDKAKEYETFILQHAKMGQVPFIIECPAYIDFGNGKGHIIAPAYYAGSPSLKEIITPRDDAGLYYDIELPYMYVRGA